MGSQTATVIMSLQRKPRRGRVRQRPYPVLLIGVVRLLLSSSLEVDSSHQMEHFPKTIYEESGRINHGVRVGPE